jgi:hypothetical protein
MGKSGDALKVGAHLWYYIPYKLGLFGGKDEKDRDKDKGNKRKQVVLAQQRKMISLMQQKQASGSTARPPRTTGGAPPAPSQSPAVGNFGANGRKTLGGQ